MARIDFLGIPIDALTFNETLSCVDRYIDSCQPHQLIAINAAKIVIAHQNPEFLNILRQSDLNFVDGKPIMFAARLLGDRFPELISGHFLMESMVARAAKHGYSVYFLGAKPDVTAKVVDVFRNRYSGLNIAGWRNGFWKPEEEHEVVDCVRESGAHILFLALGTPRKEKWINQYKVELQVPVCMGVGGSFDIVAGLLKVEPGWMRASGLAWLFRLIQEPKRLWKRYASTNPKFVKLVLRGVWERVFWED